MQKKLKFLITSLVLLPCMFVLGGCGEPKAISLNEYLDLNQKSAQTIYDTYKNYNSFSDIGYTLSISDVKTEFEMLEYKANQTDVEKTKSIQTKKTTTTTSESVNVDWQAGAENNVAISFTTIKSTLVEGYKVNTQELLEGYSDKTDTTTTLVYVKDGETYKQFYSKETIVYHNDQQVGTTANTDKVYTYLTKESYVDDINEMLVDVKEEILGDAFYQFNTLLTITNPSFYTKDKNFGYNVENLSLDTVTMLDDVSKLGTEKQLINVEFADGKPSTYSNTTTKRGTYNQDKSVECTISYAGITISVPTGTYTDSLVKEYVNLNVSI